MPDVGTTVRFEIVDAQGARPQEITIVDLVIAGWTGRNQAAVQAHIEELAAVGVPRPPATPAFYRVSSTLLTLESRIQVMGPASSGEVEPVIVATDDGLFVGVGSDHTDRRAETQGITLAKQLCPKPVAPRLWPFDEVAPHWDQLVLRSRIELDGRRRSYQEGSTAVMLDPRDLIERFAGRTLRPGTLMFCGTMAVEGEVEPAAAFEMSLDDPVLERRISHRYSIEALPVVG